MHHPIQMKPADTENRNGRCHIYSLFVNNSFFVSFKEISQTYAPIFSGLTPRNGIKPKSYKQNLETKTFFGPFSLVFKYCQKNKHKKNNLLLIWRFSGSIPTLCCNLLFEIIFEWSTLKSNLQILNNLFPLKCFLLNWWLNKSISREKAFHRDGLQEEWRGG